MCYATRRLLELFSGTGSVGRPFKVAGWEVTSVDNDPKAVASIRCDILDWDYRVYDEGYFDVVHASPPCTQYSKARTVGGPRDLEGADKLAMKALEIIDYFKPKFWFVENPDGLLRTRGFMAKLPFVVVDYCMYGMPYRKRTCIWTNTNLSTRRCDRRCGAWARTTRGATVRGRHAKTAQQGRRGVDDVGNQFTRAQLYSMPAGLCEDMLAAVSSGGL